MTKTEMIQAVRAHAMQGYDQGWDVVVEAYDDSDILKAIGAARTATGAIAAVAKRLGIPAGLPKTGYVVLTRDVDGMGRRTFKTLKGAVAYWEEMVGRTFWESEHERLEEHGWVTVASHYGTRVTILQCAGGAA